MAIDIHHEEHEKIAADNKIYGFWLYLMTDCVMFASVFAVYVVLMNNIADGPAARDIFHLPFVFVETAFLLISSVTCGLAVISAQTENTKNTVKWLLLTILCGIIFLALEVYEFNDLIAAGNGPQRSGFLSGYFALVGMHGIHVTCGVIWAFVLVAQFAKPRKEVSSTVYNTRITCFSLFWHFLDIIWICVFSVVYLLGAA